MRILAATDGGIAEISGDGRHEPPAGPGNVTALARDLSGTWWASTRDGVLRSGDGGRTWEQDGLEGRKVWTVACAPDGSLWAGLEPAALWRRTDGGWQECAALGSAPGAESWASPWGPADLSTIAFRDGEIWIGIEAGGIYRSPDGGRTWTPDFDGVYEDVHTVAIAGGSVLAATGAGLYRHAGARWEEPGGVERPYVLAVAVHPEDPNRMWVAGARGHPGTWAGGAGAAVYASTNGGRSWSAAPALPEDVSGAIGRKGLVLDGETLVAGTTDGAVLALDDGGWTALASGLPPVAVVAAG